MSEEAKIGDIKKEKINLTNQLQALNNEIVELNKQKETLVGSLKSYKEDLEKEKKEILDDVEDSQSKITRYYNEIFSDSNKDENGNLKQSIKTKIQKVFTLAENTETAINSAKEIVDGFDEDIFKNFYNKIEEREKKYNQYENDIKILKAEIEKQQKINVNIQNESQKFLQDITDKSLISTFKDQAGEKKKAYKWLFCGSIIMACVVGLTGFILILVKKSIGLEELALLPFVFAYFSLSKQADISKKLAEEYQHKASLTEYLAGYKKMWELGREDEEYIKLIEEIKKEILKNPNDFIKVGKDYPENLKDIVEKGGDCVAKLNPLK